MVKPGQRHKAGNRLLTGDESFHRSGSDVGLAVRDFWRWAYSDLGESEQLRTVGEFLVFAHIGSSVNPSEASVRVIVSLRRSGSRVVFRVPMTAVVEAAGSGGEDSRPLPILILADRERAEGKTEDPLDITRWRFWVVPAHALTGVVGARNFILMSERAVERLGGVEVGIEQIASAIGNLCNGVSGQHHEGESDNGR